VSLLSISTTNVTPSNSTEVKNENVTLEIDSTQSYYKMIVTIEGNNQYSLSTDLHIVGNYKIKGVDNNFVDNKTSKTIYSVSAQKVTFISSEKNVTNETLYYANNNELSTSSYQYTITYGDEAKISFTSPDNSPFAYLNGDVTIKKYNKGIYIDNELISFLPRALDDSSLSLSFNSIDAMSSSLKSLKYTADTTTKIVDGFRFKTTSAADYQSSSVSNTEGRKASVFKISTALSDRFAGQSLESYYVSMNSGLYKNLLLESYTKINDSIGYIKYKLDTVVTAD